MLTALGPQLHNVTTVGATVARESCDFVTRAGYSMSIPCGWTICDYWADSNCWVQMAAPVPDLLARAGSAWLVVFVAHVLPQCVWAFLRVVIHDW